MNVAPDVDRLPGTLSSGVRIGAPWFVGPLCVIVVAAAYVAIDDPVGWLGSDDAAYYSAGEHVAVGEPIRRVHHHFARSPMTLATAAVIATVGASTKTLLIPPLFCALACVVTVALIGRRLWGARTGLLAAVAIAFLPGFLNNATCLLPGSMTCFLAAAALLAAIASRECTTGARTFVGAWIAGLACGAAVSTKLFAAGVLPVVVVFLLRAEHRRRAVALTLLGFASFFALEAAIHAAVTGDPAFKWHAIEASRHEHSRLGVPAYESAGAGIRLAAQRLAMPFRTQDSGWGIVGWLFWPVMMVSLFGSRDARWLAIWTLATFLGLALVPIGYEDGWRVAPNMMITGHNLFVLAVPLSLCAARVVSRVLEARGPLPAVRRSHGMIAVLLIGLSAAGVEARGRFNSSAFQQQDVGQALTCLLEHPPFGEAGLIHTTPSIYWRYRVLFPPALRERLRVVAGQDDPSWWRDACADIADKAVSLPDPPSGYLLATPAHVAGQRLYWDYGVGLPDAPLPAWRAIEPCAVVGKVEQGLFVVGRAPGEFDFGKPDTVPSRRLLMVIRASDGVGAIAGR